MFACGYRPDRNDSELLEFPVAKAAQLSLSQLPADFKFAASVAAFGQLLRGGQFTGKFGYAEWWRWLVKDVARIGRVTARNLSHWCNVRSRSHRQRSNKWDKCVNEMPCRERCSDAVRMQYAWLHGFRLDH